MRYRKGDRYLSEKEYAEENNAQWGILLFIVGAWVAGVSVSAWTGHHNWPKWIRFTLICISAIGIGGMLASLQRYIRTVIWCIAIAGILWLIGHAIWGGL